MAFVLLALTMVVMFATAAAFADMMPAPSDASQAVTTTIIPPAVEPAAPEPAIDYSGVWYQLQEMQIPALVLLVFTIIIETPIVAIAGRGSKASWQVGVLVNMLTNPPAVLIMLIFARMATTWGQELALMAAIEISVAIIECLVFMRVLHWSLRKALVVSLIANLTSFAVGIAFAIGF